MGYSAVWKVLDQMIADFRQRGMTLPAEVMSDLKSAKTMITISVADDCRGETIQKIEQYLTSVEAYLVSEGQKFGNEYVESWLKRLDEAGQKTSEEDEGTTKFIQGVPRDQKWIRVKPSADMPIEKLQTLAKQSHLSHSVQKDGYLLVYGEDTRIKDFVKKMTTKYGVKTEK